MLGWCFLCTELGHSLISPQLETVVRGSRRLSSPARPARYARAGHYRVDFCHETSPGVIETVIKVSLFPDAACRCGRMEVQSIIWMMSS